MIPEEKRGKVKIVDRKLRRKQPQRVVGVQHVHKINKQN